MGVGALADKTLRVLFSVSLWEGRAMDRTATDEVVEHAGAALGSARVWKDLFPRRSRLSKVLKIARAARVTHYEMTLPWERGAQLLPTALYLDYMGKMTAYQGELDAAFQEFADHYDEEVQQAADALNGLYRAEDYPPITELIGKFGITVRCQPVPRSGDIRVDISQAAIDGIKAQLEADTAEATTAAMRETWLRIQTVTSRMSETLKGDKTNYHATLVSNVADLCALLPAFNLTDDPTLQAITRDLDELTKNDTTVLKENKTIRDTTGDHAADIAARVAAALKLL